MTEYVILFLQNQNRRRGELWTRGLLYGQVFPNLTDAQTAASHHPTRVTKIVTTTEAENIADKWVK